MFSFILYLYQSPREPNWIELSFYPLYFLVGMQVRYFLKERVPYLFNDLRQTGSLPDEVAQSAAADLRLRLNSGWGDILGIAAGSAIIWFYRYTLITPSRSLLWLASILVAIIDVFLAYALGIAAWKAVATAVEICRLAWRRHLRMRPFYPDECAGLGAVGRLCFSLSFVLISVGLFLCGWILYGRWINYRDCVNTSDPYCSFEPWFVGGLVVVTVVSLVAFFGPVITVHHLMKEQAADFKAKLIAFARRVSDLEESLVSQGSQLGREELEAQYAQVQFFRSAYPERRKIPTWPVDLQTFTKFLSVQIPLSVTFFTSVLNLWEKIDKLRLV